MKHPLREAVVALVLLALGSSASAQEIVQRSFETQLFEPAIGVDNFFAVEKPGVARHLGFGLGLMLNYQRKPLVVYRQWHEGTGTGFDISNAEAIDLVANQMTANLLGALGLRYRWLHAQVGFDLPINMVVSGTNVNEQGAAEGSFSASGVGDLKLQLKMMLLRDLGGFSLAFSPIIALPTGKSDSFGGDPSVGVRPRLVAGYRIGDLYTAANIGYLVRKSSTIFSSEIGNQLLYGVGAGYQVHPRLALLTELNGRAGFNTQSNCRWDYVLKERVCTDTSSSDLDAFPLELGFGGRMRVMHGLDVSAGVGFGLIRAVGSPQFRLLAGVQWAPDFTDTDGDGIPDYKDKCPNEPEDFDGFEDEDGCPDLDNDGDGIPDSEDQCPNEPEDFDGFQDHDGCPDPDNDGDGIPDIKDACPNEPETFNGIMDEDGCPDFPDRDGDGIPDDVDKCPDEPEDKDGFQDEDGCPDPDNDGDGIPDQYDDCPNEPEDFDGFQDEDGCPDPDNDGDGILDKDDKCPNEPETINGFEDEDGCPDKGAGHVIIKEDRIVITKKIFFDTNRATIKRISHSILGEIALTLKVNPQIKGVRIEGYTDSRGDAAKNKVLSQARAEAVRDYLIGRGIEASRLFAVGFGPDKPIADNRTGAGREQNRRVELMILDQAPGTAGAADAAPAGAGADDAAEAPPTEAR